MVFLSAAIFVFFQRSSPFNRLCSITAGIILLLVVSVVIHSPQNRIQQVFDNTERYISGAKNAHKSSVGLRIQMWQKLVELEHDEWILGIGSGNWDTNLDSWFPKGAVTRRFAVWNDYHSQIIWLIIQGGIVAVILYMAIAAIILYQSFVAILHQQEFAFGGLGIAIAAILVFFGLGNSLFTALREAHVIGLLLIVWNTLYRILQGRYGSSGGTLTGQSK